MHPVNLGFQDKDLKHSRLRSPSYDGVVTRFLDIKISAIFRISSSPGSQNLLIYHLKIRFIFEPSSNFTIEDYGLHKVVIKI